MDINTYVDEPAFWIDFDGTAHIELNNVDQNDIYQEFTIATKININKEKQTSKMYMGLYGNHVGNEGIMRQFFKDTTSLAGIDFTPYYDTWLDYIMTYNLTTKYRKVYINGVLKTEESNINMTPYEGFNIGTSFLPSDRQMIGKMTCLKIWDKELSAKEVADIDLFKEHVTIREKDVYSNINLKNEEEIKKIGTFVGTGYSFKN